MKASPKVLWLNWRDIKNPDAGGAEVFEHEVAKRLVERGWDITLFSSRFQGCVPEDELDGVKIIRGGGRFQVYREAKDYTLAHLSEFDFIVDEINTRPFLTPKYVRNKPILALIHQLAKEYWFYETPWPISWVGYHYLERAWLRHYFGVKTITVSESTRADLTNLGFRDVHVVPEGLSVSVANTIPVKEKDPTLVFLGRLKRVKQPDHAIRAYKVIRSKCPEARLWILGDGYLRAELEKENVAGVEIKGRVTDSEKVQLISRAHILLFPAVREGFGLSIIEANARGTPAVGYNVPGVRDAIKDKETGLLVEPDNWHEMAEKALTLLQDTQLRESLAARSIQWARTMSWDTTATRVSEVTHYAGWS